MLPHIYEKMVLNSQAISKVFVGARNLSTKVRAVYNIIGTDSLIETNRVTICMEALVVAPPQTWPTEDLWLPSFVVFACVWRRFH